MKTTQTKAKHTPGPWIFDGANGKILIGKHELNIPCALHSNRAEYHEDCLANAKLIAAAPDLLEALKTCKEYFDYMNGNNHVASREARELMNAAIKKATT